MLFELFEILNKTMKIHDKRLGGLDALLATSQYHKQEIHLRLTLNTAKVHYTHGKTYHHHNHPFPWSNFSLVGLTTNQFSRYKVVQLGKETNKTFLLFIDVLQQIIFHIVSPLPPA